MIGISQEHQDLAAAVQAWAAGLGTTAAIRALEDDPAGSADWSTTAATMGLTAVALPEPVGGGGSLLDQAVALEAAAYALVPGPLLSSAVGGLVAPAYAAGVASGSVRFGIDRDGVVADGPTATHVLTRGTSGWRVAEAGALDLRAGASPDLSRGVAQRVGDVAGGDPVEVDDARVERLQVVLAAAEASGVARWCLDAAVAHARTREQFGRPIGAFQAVKHLCAEMLETSASVTAAAWDAARPDDDAEQAELACLVARTICFDGAVEVAHACIQVLGGIGFTFEHDAHLYLRRALALRALYAGPDAPAALAGLAAGGARRTLRLDVAGQDDFRADVRALMARTGADRIALADAGLVAPHWPAPYGLGADAAQQLVVDEELARAGVRPPELAIGAWAAPTILAHGTSEQQERYVGATLRGEIAWCQLFSEPGAGSDLAALRTRAVRDGDGWRLSGQKVWTSMAREADWAICLARTSTEERPQAGITYFLVDMRAPGIDVRPLRELTGESLFNEVFLDDVRVPDECVVGEVGQGWRLAVTTLANERVAMAGSRLGDSVERALGLLDPPWAREVGVAVAWATVVQLLAARAALRRIAGAGPGPESSVAKLVGVRSRQDAAALVVRMLGPRALLDDDLARDAVHEQLLTRCLSIAGGTTQILRNLAGERILGLPRG